MIDKVAAIVHLPIAERPAKLAELNNTYDDFAGKTYETLSEDRKIFVNDIAKFAKNICIVCKKHGTTFYCGNCKIERYCGAECQAKDWPKHKKYCKKG